MLDHKFFSLVLSKKKWFEHETLFPLLTDRYEIDYKVLLKMFPRRIESCFSVFIVFFCIVLLSLSPLPSLFLFRMM